MESEYHIFTVGCHDISSEYAMRSFEEELKEKLNELSSNGYTIVSCSVVPISDLEFEDGKPGLETSLKAYIVAYR